MEFFEKLGKKASETFNSTSEKASKIANDTKLKFKINECKGKINDIYKEIGKKVYEKFVLDGNLEIKDDIQEELNKIKELTNQIEEFEKQRLELADMRQCEKCKNKIEKSAKFCPECGAEQPEEEIHEPEIIENEEQKECENTENVVEAEPVENENIAEEVSENVSETVEETIENTETEE